MKSAQAVAASLCEASAVRSPIWQRGFFDHVLRNDENYGQKWNYIRENPVRAGLVNNAEDWPYSGELVVIDRV
jgi:putative transposase